MIRRKTNILVVGYVERIIGAFFPLIIDTSLKIMVLKVKLLLDYIMIVTKHKYSIRSIQ